MTTLFRAGIVRFIRLLVMTTAIALAVAASASAEVFQFDEHDPAVTQTFDCGAVLTFTTDVNGRFIVNGNDDFVRVVEQFTFTGTINYQGRTFRANDHQTGTTFVSRDDVLTSVLNGQGLFTVFPGLGLVFDVGHLVFVDDTGETLLASNKAVGFDEPFDFGAAVCAILAS
jgi:hypothetical protein